jgi:Xaa-Pro aminopeptidase
VTSIADTAVYTDRLARVRTAMEQQDVDVLLLSVGYDLPYLTGYLAMPLERLTMLVVPRHGEATLVIPQLEAPRVTEQPGCLHTVGGGKDQARSWPVVRARTATIGDQTGPAFSSTSFHTCRRRSSNRRRRRPVANAEGRRWVAAHQRQRCRDRVAAAAGEIRSSVLRHSLGRHPPA